MDARALSNRLKEAWSSSTLESTYTSSEALRTIASDFSKFDQRIQMRLLIGLLFNPKNRREYASGIKSLLRAAVETSKANEGGKWVGVMAGIVHRRLFDTNDRDIEALAGPALDEAARATAAALAATEAVSEVCTDMDSLNAYRSHFMPFECKLKAGGE